MLATLDQLTATNARAPQMLRFRDWAVFGGRYLGFWVDETRLYHLSLDQLAHQRVLDRLALSVRKPVFVVRDPTIGFLYVVQLAKKPAEAKPVGPDLPRLVKIDLTHALPLSIPFGVLAGGAHANVAQYLDLSQPHHILVAGTTQTGKSSWLQAALTTLCIFNRPDQVNVAIIDPKGEFVHWRNTSHLHAPIASEAQPAMKLLGDIVTEMDRRRSLFESATARNLKQYELRTGEHLPLLVVVIDEFVDLTLEIGRAYLPVLMRLVNKAASYGIRLILATQHPKADVVDSALRSQCGIRIAFRCTDAWQSESVLGQGKRDACRLPDVPGRFVAVLPGAVDVVEGQGFYVDDATLDAVTERLRLTALAPVFDATTINQRDRDIALYCLSQKDKAGLFISTRIAKRFSLHPRAVAALAVEWDRRQWLLPEASCRGRLSKSIRDLVGWADQA